MENRDSGEELRAAAGRLKKAVTLLGGPPQAHRRTTQMGRFQATCRFVEEDGARAGEMVKAGLLTQEQAERIAIVRARLVALRTGRDDFLEEKRSAPREFLWSDALEDDEWEAVRQAARACHKLLDVAPDPLER